MINASLSADTLDDAMRTVIESLLANGKPIENQRGKSLELTGILIEIRDPLSRVSRTDARGKVFSCLGELCWYLAGSDELTFIEYYIPRYKDEADGAIIPGAYGPRLRSGRDQLFRCVDILTSKPTSRQAVIQLFDASDLDRPPPEEGGIRSVPCTCTLQFLVRDDQLELIVHMRSNDAYLGITHDVFAFTMMQELVARRLELDLGRYRHFVGSLHLYEADKSRAKSFVDEGWQDFKVIMPPMPKGDPWPALRDFLAAEGKIRGEETIEDYLSHADPYWADLARLLLVFRAKRKRKDEAEAGRIAHTLSHAPYRDFFTPTTW